MSGFLIEKTDGLFSVRPKNMYWSQHVIAGIICLLLTLTDCNLVRNEDICGSHNGRRLYLELGERGVLYAKNVTLVKSSGHQQYNVGNSSHEQCSLELVTCPSCVIVLTFKSISLSHHCADGDVLFDSPCRCDYVWISEPPYEDVSGTPFCTLYAPVTYRSSTRTLSIVLLYSQQHKHAFTIEYTAERNRLHLRGTEIVNGGTNSINTTSGGILTSPFFPARYPRDLGLEYIITCPVDAVSCRIRLLFSDFQLATVSIMEFYDWNGQRIEVSSGAKFRPPVIVSSGPSLLIRFYANGGTGLGYKAFYSFVIGHQYDKTVQPITDCGGYVENLGGAITMMDMVGQGIKTYDCVWLIRPLNNFLHMKTHMYLKVIAFSDMAGNTELIIKEGPTSALLPLEILRHPVSQLQSQRWREHVTTINSGFHVSLRGTFGPASHLAIAYAAFSYTDCFTGSDFLCQNHRCLSSQLNCDGFDHCGDNSDEPATCFQDLDLEPRDRKWHMNKPNYYFPKIEHYPDLKTATLVFVASSIGLIVLISALIILLYRIGARARQQRELQSRLQTISELLGDMRFDIADGARIDEITVSDDPPEYEAPPGYDEVVKLSYDADDVRRKKPRVFQRERRSRNSSSRYSSCLGNDEPCSSYANPTRTNFTRNNNEMPETPPPSYVTPPEPRTPCSTASSIQPESENRNEGNEETESEDPNVAEEERNESADDSGTNNLDAVGAYESDGNAANIENGDVCSGPQPSLSRGASRRTNRNCARAVVGCVAEGSADEKIDRRDELAENEQSCKCEGACGCASLIEEEVYPPRRNSIQSRSFIIGRIEQITKQEYRSVRRPRKVIANDFAWIRPKSLDIEPPETETVEQSTSPLNENFDSDLTSRSNLNSISSSNLDSNLTLSSNFAPSSIPESSSNLTLSLNLNSNSDFDDTNGKCKIAFSHNALNSACVLLRPIPHSSYEKLYDDNDSDYDDDDDDDNDCDDGEKEKETSEFGMKKRKSRSHSSSRDFDQRDSFLANGRFSTVKHSRSNPVAVMLFGTPGRTSKSIPYSLNSNRSVERRLRKLRVWRSTDNDLITFPN